MMIKRSIKRILLAKKGIMVDKKSDVNLDVKKEGDKSVIIKNSFVQLSQVGEGTFIENAYIYGMVNVGRFVSISGPGTIIHREINDIRIGSFTSIAPNVSIHEFNHNMRLPSTYAMNFNIFKESNQNDFISKGSVLIEEDVWIGANVSILSGVSVGRGSVIGAGSVVTSNIPRYSVAVGNPCRVIKKRFSEDVIQDLENMKWWKWSYEDILRNKKYFLSHCC